MDKDLPRIDRIDGILWLAIALLLPVVYLMTSWVWNQNELRDSYAGQLNPAIRVSQELD